jgi:hypothetical protein
VNLNTPSSGYGPVAFDSIFSFSCSVRNYSFVRDQFSRMQYDIVAKNVVYSFNSPCIFKTMNIKGWPTSTPTFTTQEFFVFGTWTCSAVEASFSVIIVSSVMLKNNTIKLLSNLCKSNTVFFLNSAGNKLFRKMVLASRQKYTKGIKKSGRALIVRSVIDHVHCHGGRFLQKDWSGRYVSMLK